MPRTLPLVLPGVGLGAYRGVAAAGFENRGAPIDVRPVGVEVAFCAFLKGDSGRGSDGRDLGFNAGLGARPGPTDWLNLDVTGVGVAWELFSARPPRLKAASDGVVGVGGDELNDSVGDALLKALFDGRKIPEPGMDVVKYRVLGRAMSYAKSLLNSVAHSPIYVAIIFPPSCKFSAELNAGEDALLAPHFANEFDRAMHAPRHIDWVSYFKVIARYNLLTRGKRSHRRRC